MIELVPTEDDLVIEALIKPADISNIRLDDLVRIRFSAYDSSRYGTVDGRVVRISPDAVQDRDEDDDDDVRALRLKETEQPLARCRSRGPVGRGSNGVESHRWNVRAVPQR